MIVSEFLIQKLEEQGVEYAYGCIGGSVTYLIDSLYTKSKIKFIHSYNEQAAAYSASASAKYTGRLGVAIATSGPGATNMVTGIADAYFDSAPVLFITGQVNTYDFKYNRPIRQCGFQETDIVSITKPITKYSTLLDKIENVEEEITKVIRIATTGRKGPVVLDIPLNIQRTQINHTGMVTSQFYDNNTLLSREDINLVVKLYDSSKKPLLLLGGGCRGGDIKSEVVKFSERLNIPVVVSLLGKDCFPNDHRLYAGFIGSYGNRFGNLALAKCDLLIVLGSRLDSRQVGNEISPFTEKEIIQVDIDPDHTDTRFKRKTNIIIDVYKFLYSLNNYIEEKKIKVNENVNWIDSIKCWEKTFHPLSEINRSNNKNFHYLVLDEISRNLQSDDIICTDIGQNQMIAAQVLNISQSRRFITSGGMAPMGFGVPAGIAIALDSKKRTIVITGDGGLQMNIQELNTINFLGLPIVIFVFNNKSLGMIKQFQYLYFNSRYYDTDKDSGYNAPDFLKIAQAYGIKSVRITEKTPAWRRKIREILMKEKDQPLLVDIDFNYQTFIYPKLEYDKPIHKIDPQLRGKEKDLAER